MKQVRKAGHGRRWLVAGALAVTAAVCSVVALAQPAQAEDATTYTLYPTPQVMTYGEGTVVLAETADVYVGGDIDNYTVDRLDETLALKGMEKTIYDSVDALPFDGDTDVIVGVQGSGDGVETYVEDLGLTVEEGLFEKTDAYLLAFVPDTDTADARIVVLGKDTDSAFYGLTTVYQLFQQVEGYEVREFTMSDWADVVSRGFIEGYYGNPWSQEDREDLMRWGGYHKLNVYVYAPKDDLKHRLHWRQKYTDEEIEKIAALAKAGNESKCRFVYALLPFYKPGENGMDGNTEESLGTKVDAKFDLVNNYEADLEVLKARYLQVIDAGVRQIALLADDAWNQGGENYLRLLRDLTTWLQELQQLKNPDGSPKYPGLKTTIPYVGAQWTYTGTGESWYQQAPDNIQFVLTGNQTFGAVSSSFIAKVQANTGRNPFMWINWPCTDPLPNYLTMGGHNTFLEAGVEPGSVDGIMLNPMQQSQPSKQAIFMVSEYAWNIWETEDHADQVWQDSFSYLENNSPNATEASDALRELSSHMRMSTSGTTSTSNGNPSADYSASVPGQDRPFGFWVNDESKDFSGETNPAATMDALKDAVEAGTVDAQTIADARATYQRIVDAANTYESKHTNDEMWKQIEPFIKALRDKAQASLLYLDTIEAAQSEDKNDQLAARALLADANAMYEQSRTYTYTQLGTPYEAKAGHEYVEPTLEALKTCAGNAFGQSTDGYTTQLNGLEAYYQSNNDPSALYDDDMSTFYWVHSTSSSTEANASVTVTFPTALEITSIHFLQDTAAAGTGAGDYMTEGTIAYQDALGTWHDVEQLGGRAEVTKSFDNPVTAQAIRVTNTEKREVWWKIYDFSVTVADEDAITADELVQMVADAREIDTDAWTTSAKTALETAIAGAQGSPASLNDAAAELALAMRGELRYTGKGPGELVSNADGAYTVASYGNYKNAYDAFATAMQNANDLSQAEGERLAGQLAAAKEALVATSVRPANPVTGIEVAETPNVIEYETGDALDATGLELTVSYERGPAASVVYGTDNASEFSFSPSTFSTAGDDVEVTVTYGGQTATFTVKVVEATVEPEPQPTTHTVTVVLGNGEANLTFEVEDGKTAPKPADPARDGYVFAGWFTTVDPATGSLSGDYFFTEPVTGDLTIYAGWRPVGGGQQPGQPTTPDPDDNKGDQTGNQPQGNGAQRPAQSGSDGTLAKTGDPASLAAVLATAIAGAGAVVASRRRR